MSSLNIVPASLQHCSELAGKVSDTDRDDIMRGWAVDPLQGLLMQIGICKDSWSALIDGKVIMMFGCMEDGCMWMIRSPELDQFYIRFIRKSRRIMAGWKAKYGEIFCVFAKQYEKLIRFLENEGFVFEDVDANYTKGVF